MIKKGFLSVLVVGMALVLASSHSDAARYKYEETDVKNGGTITGVVNLKGEPPPPIMENLKKGKNSEFCVQHPDATEDGVRPRVKVRANDGKLNGAVVFIQDLKKGKAWPLKTANFDFKLCDVTPKITVVRRTPRKYKGERVREGVVTITNHDPEILHNPHGYSVVGARRKTLFNKPLPNKGDVADVTRNMMRLKKRKDNHFFLQCDQHNFMEADARIVWNPYYSVTGDDGSFKIDQIPPGKYKVTAWHPYAGEVTKEITVSGGGEAKAEFTLKAKIKK